MHVVWYKRDLRLHDHRPLIEAARRGPTVGLYIYEPALLHAHDFDPAHLTFINESLAELRHDLRSRGGRLVIRHGDAGEVLQRLHRDSAIDGLWSHEETGTMLTFARDRAVRRWARAHGIPWTELPQNGVVRGLRSRDGWSGNWNARMGEPVSEPPPRLESGPVPDDGAILTASELGLVSRGRARPQRGGESMARTTLDDFLASRGVRYRTDMSSPLTGETACSRLSPYLAWGNISMRQVFQATSTRQADVRHGRADGEPVDPRWRSSLSSFASRLRWHCHFMQKLEDQPDLEAVNMCRAYDGLREDAFDPDRFSAWCEGRTGFPMVDACMHALQDTGWINFRMRAMLVSFACYHLWLHWKPVADHLSRLFLDYEPGIHYTQAQMQAGVTGINAIRIYSPVKQARDQDPDGVFIRRHLPALARIPCKFLAEPHTMPIELQHETGCRIGRDYPAPIVDHATAYRTARQRMHAVRRQPATRAEAARVYAKHGSRKRSQRSAS